MSVANPIPKFARQAENIIENFRAPVGLNGMSHLSDEDLECYHLGMIRDEAELAPFEEHLLACGHCTTRAAEVADYVDAVRSGIIAGHFDSE